MRRPMRQASSWCRLLQETGPLAFHRRTGEVPLMPTRPYILAESTWKTVDATPYDVAVLPWGATEAHNFHLPYATDNIQCDALAAEAARRAWERGAKVVVLPCVPFGANTT